MQLEIFYGKIVRTIFLVDLQTIRFKRFFIYLRVLIFSTKSLSYYQWNIFV